MCTDKLYSHSIQLFLYVTYIINCEMKLIIHSKTSAVVPLKFERINNFIPHPYRFPAAEAKEDMGRHGLNVSRVILGNVAWLALTRKTETHGDIAWCCQRHWMGHGQPYMMTSSNGNIFRVTGPLCGEFTGPGEFPTQRPVTRSFDFFFDLRLNKRLSKQSSSWWFETPPWSLWRQCNDP